MQKVISTMVMTFFLLVHIFQAAVSLLEGWYISVVLAGLLGSMYFYEFGSRIGNIGDSRKPYNSFKESFGISPIILSAIGLLVWIMVAAWEAY